MELRNDVLEAQLRAAQSDLKVYDVRAGADLMKEYRRLAKVADQRLVRIEAAKHDKGYGSIEKYAYANAMRSIHSFSGEGAKRFNTKPPDNPQALQRKINDILVFLNSPTTTKSGVKKVYEKNFFLDIFKFGQFFIYPYFYLIIDETLRNQAFAKFRMDKFFNCYYLTTMSNKAFAY